MWHVWVEPLYPCIFSYGAGSIGQLVGGDSFLVGNSGGLAVWNYQ
jgi:hypothetical protein